MTDPADDLIEAMARALGEVEAWAIDGVRLTWSDLVEIDRDYYRKCARAALAVARPAILEEAAKVAENMPWETGDRGERVYPTASEAAHRIRALSPPVKEGGHE